MADQQRLLILDRDGVINRDSDDYIKTPEEWQPLPGSLEAIADLTSAGFRIAVVSNQSGVARGFYTLATLERINEKMLSAVAAQGGHIAGVYYCPHAPGDDCDCRKPAPGLVRRMERELGVSAAGVPLIGDKLSDMELARNVGARPILVRTGYGESALRDLADSSVEVFVDLSAAASALIAESNQ